MVMPIEIREPAPRPCSARNAMSCSMVCASPASAEPRRNKARPARYVRRRPSWSASRPQIGIVTVEVRRKAENVHE
jgi:hypothetical protein